MGNKYKIVKQRLTNVGRCVVTLSVKCKLKTFLVHRLVAIAFIGNINNNPNVLHKDDNPLNNTVPNLWWGTQKDNIIDCHNKGRAVCNLPKYEKGDHPFLGKNHSEEAKLKMKKNRIKIPIGTISLMLEDIKNNVGNKTQVAKKYGVSISYLTNLSNGRGERLIELRNLK